MVYKLIKYKKFNLMILVSNIKKYKINKKQNKIKKLVL